MTNIILIRKFLNTSVVKKSAPDVAGRGCLTTEIPVSTIARRRLCPLAVVTSRSGVVSHASSATRVGDIARPRGRVPDVIVAVVCEGREANVVSRAVAVPVVRSVRDLPSDFAAVVVNEGLVEAVVWASDAGSDANLLALGVRGSLLALLQQNARRKDASAAGKDGVEAQLQRGGRSAAGVVDDLERRRERLDLGRAPVSLDSDEREVGIGGQVGGHRLPRDLTLVVDGEELLDLAKFQQIKILKKELSEFN